VTGGPAVTTANVRDTGGLARLSPAYFGMVMATGIVSLAAHLLGYPRLARPLWFANIGFYAVLVTLTVARVVRFPRLFFADMVDHLRGPGFFTTVAASSILGSQFVILGGNDGVGTALWVVALVLWVAFTYAIFAALTIKEHKPSLDQGISGGWLLAVVATQSITVLSALLAAHFEQPYRLRLNFLALSMWLWGGMLYIWMMSLIFYRYTFFRFSPGDLSPPYWINMGAMAISALAGSRLILNAPDAPLLLSLLPFLKGFTIFYWATGTWWIPMLLVLAAWRYIYKRFPLKYDPLYWGAVFPLGMYAVSTHQLGRALAFESIQMLSPVFLFVALAAWTAAFIGLGRSLLRRSAA
jgi:tellurite resistance protein TehA-like permease